MVLRKGKAALTSMQKDSWLVAEGSTECKLYNNPFAKPAIVWNWIYGGITIKGQRVLDPFAGVGSSTRAAINFGLRPVAVEISDQHYPHLLENIKSQFLAINSGSKVIFS